MGTRATALAVLIRWLGLPVPGAPVRRSHVSLGRTGSGAEIDGVLWSPPARAPALILAAGITPRGVHDPRLVRVASAIAASGRVVFAPRLALSERRLDPRDVDRLVGAVEALAGHGRCDGTVTAVGFSFGGSYVLVAAADPGVREHLYRVAAVGAYADLRALIPRLRRHVDVDVVRAALEDQVDGGSISLGPDARQAVEDLVEGRLDPRELPAVLARRIDRLSPATFAGDVEAEIVLLHAAGDPVVPVSELDVLRRCFPGAQADRLRSFTHVDFRPTWRRLRDAWHDLLALWRFTRAVLEPPRRGRLG